MLLDGQGLEASSLNALPAFLAQRDTREERVELEKQSKILQIFAGTQYGHLFFLWSKQNLNQTESL